MKSNFKAIMAILLVAVLVTGCSSGSGSPQSAASSTASYSVRNNQAPMAVPEKAVEMEYYAMDAVEAPSLGGGDTGDVRVNTVVANASRKIIMTVNLNMETKEFDAGVDRVTELVAQYGGFVQSSYVEGKSLYDERGSRSARYTLRVPAEKVSEIILVFGENFNITSTDQYGDDITDSYYDTEARLHSLKIQEQQLLEMLGQAGELQYLLEVQRELANVRYEIESLTSSLQRMDSYVSMSTVNVYLREVVEYEQLRNEPASFIEELRMTMQESGRMFARFCRNVILFLVVFFPYMAILLVIILLFVFMRRRRKRRMNEELRGLQKELRVHAMPGQNEDSPQKPDDTPRE